MQVNGRRYSQLQCLRLVDALRAAEAALSEVEPGERGGEEQRRQLMALLGDLREEIRGSTEASEEVHS